MSFKIIGQRFTPGEFAAYLDGIHLAWAQFLVIHNTSAPTLAQCPNGITQDRINNLYDYYANQQGWSGGPHLFVDPYQIWVFNPLDKIGVHSPSWNSVSIGIEMLGEYESESFSDGRGLMVRDMTVQAVAVLLKKMGLPAANQSIRFHKEDPATTHRECPGKNVDKVSLITSVARALMPGGGTVAASPPPVAAQPNVWQVVGPDGVTIRTSVAEGPGGTALVRACVEAVGGAVQADAATKTIRLSIPIITPG